MATTTLTVDLPAPAGFRPDDPAGSIFFVGTATVILRYAGFTILTDPNFVHAGDHVHLGYGLTARRRTDPAIDIDQLPPLDLCLVSHYHGDHFDQVAEARLPRDLPIATTRHAAAALGARGFSRAYPLDTWDHVRFSKGEARVRVTAMPGRHGPPIVSRLLPPVMGSMLEFEPVGACPALVIYVSGDTLVFDRLREIPRRYPMIDLGLFHLGGTRIMGLLLTMDAQQGVEAIRTIDPREAIPIHYDDYEVFRSPLEDFQRAAAAAGLASRITYLGRGETYTFDLTARRRHAG